MSERRVSHGGASGAGERADGESSTGREGRLRGIRRRIRMPLLLAFVLLYAKCTNIDGTAPQRAEAEISAPVAESALPDAQKELLRRARTYDRRVRDYEGVFVIQERIGGTLNAPGTSRFRFRNDPFSVTVHRLNEGGRARRLLYVEGQNDGKMIVRPTGVLGRIASGILIDPHGSVARKGCLNAITDFGLRNALTRILAAYKQSAARKQLTSECHGVGELGGRRTLVLRKAGPAGKVIFELDVETLLPLRVRRYAPDDELLAMYRYKDLRFNCEFTDSEFSRKANGF
jgi:hypothetical protein